MAGTVPVPPGGGKDVVTTAQAFSRRRRTFERTYDVLRQPPERRAKGWTDEARRTLHALAESKTPRVVKLRLLVDTLRRQSPRVRQALDAEVRHVLRHTLPTTGGELPPDTLVDQAKELLDAVVEAPGEAYLEEPHWRQLAEESGRLFGFAVAERTFEGGCNDQELARKLTPEGDAVDSRVLIAQFWTDQPPSAFIDYVSPRNWPNCSSFWESMEPLSDVVREPNGNYTGVFEEVVRIDNNTTLRVPLEVGLRMNADLSRVWARFNIDRGEYQKRKAARDPVPVDVDTGTVSAETVPGGPAPTRVRATKYLHAPRGSDADRFAELACDSGWSEMMITMAFSCSPDGPSEVAAAAARARAAAPATVPAGVATGQFVGRVVKDCKDGIDTTGQHVQQLLSRFTGPSWDPRWINDLLDIGVVTAERYGRVLGHLRGLADSLADDDQRGSR
jgi:hypothetical protein